jgi:16S rRNA (guanine527-N7)-methyltransferase
MDKRTDVKLKQYNEMLITKNAVINLTAHKTYEDSWQKNICDSLLFGEEFEKLEDADILDIGSGGGLPAIPLAIKYPFLNITLLDSVGKKVSFLNEVINNLQLPNATAVHIRIEEFAANNRNKFDVTSAKAVAALPTLLEYALPLLKIGGFLYAFKGQNYMEEIAASQNALQLLGGTVEKIAKRKLNNEITRYLVIIKKVKETPKKFPRKNNLPRSLPL